MYFCYLLTIADAEKKLFTSITTFQRITYWNTNTPRCWCPVSFNMNMSSICKLHIEIATVDFLKWPFFMQRKSISSVWYLTRLLINRAERRTRHALSVTRLSSIHPSSKSFSPHLMSCSSSILQYPFNLENYSIQIRHGRLICWRLRYMGRFKHLPTLRQSVSLQLLRHRFFSRFPRRSGPAFSFIIGHVKRYPTGFCPCVNNA